MASKITTDSEIAFDILEKSVPAFNKWREDNPDSALDFRDIKKFDFRGMELEGVHFNTMGHDNKGVVNLSGVDFGPLATKGSRRRITKMAKADFTGANINGACFDHAVIDGMIFHGIASDVSFRAASIEGAQFSEAQFVHADFSDAKLNGADIKGTKFTWFTNLSKTDFHDISRPEGNMDDFTTFSFVIHVPIKHKGRMDERKPNVFNTELKKRISDNISSRYPSIITERSRRELLAAGIGLTFLSVGSEEGIRRHFPHAGRNFGPAPTLTLTDFGLVQSLETSTLPTDLAPYLAPSATAPDTLPTAVISQPPAGALQPADHNVNAVVLSNGVDQSIDVLKGDTHVLFPKAELGNKTIVLKNPDRTKLDLVFGQDIAEKIQVDRVVKTGNNWDIMFSTVQDGPLSSHIHIENAPHGFSFSMLGPKRPNVLNHDGDSKPPQNFIQFMDITNREDVVVNAFAKIPEVQKTLSGVESVLPVPEEVPVSSLQAKLRAEYDHAAPDKRKELLRGLQKAVENDPQIGTNFLNTLEESMRVTPPSVERRIR